MVECTNTADCKSAWRKPHRGLESLFRFHQYHLFGWYFTTGLVTRFTTHLFNPQRKYTFPMRDYFTEEIIKRLEEKRTPLFGQTWEECILLLREVIPEVIEWEQEALERAELEGYS